MLSILYCYNYKAKTKVSVLLVKLRAGVLGKVIATQSVLGKIVAKQGTCISAYILDLVGSRPHSL